MKTGSPNPTHSDTVRPGSLHRRASIALPVALLALLGVTSSTRGATGSDTWQGGSGAANFSAASNWASGSANQPPITGDALYFGTAGANGATVNCDQNSFTYAGITFNFGASAFTLVGNPFTLNGSLNNNGTTLETINNNIVLNANTTISLNSGGGNVTLNGVISGAKSLLLSGNGTLTLNGVNTFTGGLTLGYGSQINFNNSSAVGSGTAIINGGTMDNTSMAQVALGGMAGTWNGDFTFGGTSPLFLGYYQTLGGNRTVTVNGSLLGLTRNLSDGGNGYSLTKAGPGILFMNPSATAIKFNSTSGSPTLTLAQSSVASVAVGQPVTGTGVPPGSYVTGITITPGTTTNVTLSANATATGTGVSFNFYGGNYSGGTTINGGLIVSPVDGGAAFGVVPATTQAGNVILNGGGYSYIPASQGVGQWPATRGIYVGPTSGSGGGTFDLPYNDKLTNLAVIANNPGGTGSLTKSGQGTLILAAGNTYSGGTTNNGGGILQLDFSQPAAPTVNILNGTAGGLTLGGGTFLMNGKASTVNAQTVQGVTIIGGRNFVTNIVNSATSLTFTPGAITRTAGEVDFGNTGTYSGASGTLGAWATYNGLSDFAVVSSGSIAAQNSTVGFPASGGSSSGNYYTNANTTTLTGPLSANTLRLGGGTLALGANNLTLASGGGVLATNSSTISGTGYLGSGASELIVQTKSGATLTCSAPLIGSGASGGLTVGGAGTLSLSSANTYTGATTVDGGTLTIASGGSLGASSAVKVNTGGLLTIASGGTVSGNVEIAPSSAASANFNNSGTLSGTLTLDTAEAPVAANANTIGPVTPGYATLNNGSSTAGINDNGILTINSGATTLGSIGTITCTNGYGAIYYGSTVNNTLTLGNGSSFSDYYPQVNSVSTIQVANSGTVGISWFGYQTAGLNASCTLQNGTFNIGQIGQGNSSAQFVGTANLTNGATVNILNGGYAHGAWNVNSGTLNFYGAVSEGNQGAANIGLKLAVPAVGSSTSALNILGGGLTLALGAANSAVESSSLSVNTGGSANLGGGLVLGSSTAQTSAETNAVTLAGGKLVVNGTVSATVAGSVMNNSFNWTGGQLSAATITPSAAFNGSSSSISSTTLSQTAGTMAPGDVGYSGLTTINGAYTLGSGATVAIDIGGTNASASFQDSTNSGRYDKIAVTGALTLGNSTLNVSLINGFTPNNSDTYTIMTCGSSSGTFGNLIGGIIRLANGGSFTVTVNATSVVLSNYQVGEVWRGTTANWTDANAWRVGVSPVTYASGDTVNFDDTASSGSVGVPSSVTPAAVLFNNSSLAYTLSGAGGIGGTNSLIKNGTATVSLSSVNTYTGNTYINAGTLALTGSGSISSSPIIYVAGGAKFDVSGKSSTFVLQSGQTISNSPTSLATLAGNLNASAGAFAITFTPGTVPLTMVNGTLTLSAGTGFNLSNLGPRLANCTLIAAGAGGSVAGTPPYSSVGSITLNGGTGHLAINSGSLNLVVDTASVLGIEPLHWAGTGSGVWDAADSGNTIWNDSTTPTALATYYVDGDTVQLDEQYISANQALTLNSTVSPAITLVSNANYNYTIAGGGTIAGSGSLIKLGAATLTLSNANTFTGGTIISNGVIQMGNPTALGSTGAKVGVINGAVLDVNGTTMTSANTNILTLNGSGPIGNGALINSSSTAANFFGPITLGSASTIKAVGGNLTLGSGSADPITGNYALTVGGVSQVDVFGNIQVGSVTKVDTGVFRIESANSFAGGLMVKSGGAVAKNGASYGTGPVYLLDTTGSLNATANLGVTATFTNSLTVQAGSSGIATLDNYSGYSPTWAGSITLNTNLTLKGGSGQILTVSGPISGSGGLNTASYNSDSTINLSGTNTYSGATYVTIGKLALTGGGSVSNTSSIIVSGGATFDVTAASSGTLVLQPGQTLGNIGGTANLNGAFNASSGAVAVSCDGTTPVFSINGSLTLAAGTAFTVNPAVGMLSVGTHNLIQSGVLGTAPTTVNMARGAGYLVINGGGGLDLVVTSATGPVEPLHWVGSGTGLWQNLTPTNVWKDSSAVPAFTGYVDNIDTVLFDETYITSNQVVTLNSTVTPPNIVVSNSTYDYTISGYGTIGGNATLTKTGNSNLVVQCGINTTGMLTNNGGTIQLALGGLYKVGGLSGGGGTLNVTTNRLIVNLQGQTETYSGNLAGNFPVAAGTTSAYGLLATNSGTLTLSGAIGMSADFLSLGGSSSFSRIGAQYGAELDLAGTTMLTNVTIWNNQLGVVRVTGGNHSVSFTGGNTNRETAYGVILQDSSQFIVDGGSVTLPTAQIGYGGGPINAGPSLTVNGGALTVGVNDSFATNGLWIGDNVAAGTVSTLNLNGGVLTVTAILDGNGETISGNNVINFNGGKLVCASTNVIPTDNGYNGSNPIALMVGNNGAVIDTAGFDNTIILPLQNNGTGGLTKLGSGKLTLTASSTYQGATVVSNGTLLVNGSLDPAGTVTVQSGGTLGGSGTIGGAVAFNSGSHAVFALGTPLTLSSSLTVAASGTTPDVHLVLSNNVPVGTYTLATYSGGSGVFNSTPVIDSGSLAAGTAATIVTTAGTVTLQVAAHLAPTPTNITYTVTGPTSMTLNWPTGQGWLLQSNSVSLSNTGAWQTVSGATPPYPITINPNQANVFYRLKY